MILQVVSLLFLLLAIGLGFAKKINVGLVSLGLAFILGRIGGVSDSVLFSGFPNKLFLTLLGTMLFFSMLQNNHTLELLAQKIVALVGKRTFLIPIILYIVSFGLSAAGPGAIAVQSVMILFAVSLAVEMKASPLMMASMAYLGAVGGTASPIALTGIIISDITEEMGITGISGQVFLGVGIANMIWAIILYIFFKGYRLKTDENILMKEIPKFDRGQKIGVLAIAALIILVVGFQFDVGLVSFILSLLLILFKIADEKSAVKKLPWSTTILICGVSVLMSAIQEMGGIQLLADMLSSMMSPRTASPLIGLTAGIMSWFSSANGVVFPALVPTIPDIVNGVGGDVTVVEMIMATVVGATFTGISPFSTGGSLTLAAFAQETNASEKEQQSTFLKLILLSAVGVLEAVIFALIGGFRLFC